MGVDLDGLKAAFLERFVLPLQKLVKLRAVGGGRALNAVNCTSTRSDARSFKRGALRRLGGLG
jgi:hypothetical protein